MKQIIVIIVIVLILSGVGYAQISNLTDRELLIQLNEKINNINEGITRIENRFAMQDNKIDILNNKIEIVETRVTATEINLNSLCGKVEDLTAIWYWVLGLFGILVISIIVYVWKGIYGNRKANNKVNLEA